MKDLMFFNGYLDVCEIFVKVLWNIFGFKQFKIKFQFLVKKIGIIFFLKEEYYGLMKVNKFLVLEMEFIQCWS